MRCLVFLCLAAVAAAAPSMYAKEDQVYRLELVPVSSTVIPLEDLEYTVGVGFSVHSPKNSKHYPKKAGTKSELITAANKNRKTSQNQASVKQLTKADFDRF